MGSSSRLARRSPSVPAAQDPEATSTMTRMSLPSWPPDRGWAVPRGFQPIPADVLAGLVALPCPVFVPVGRRAVLYAPVGADAAVVGRRVGGGLMLLIRTGDADALRSALAAALPGVLADERLAPEERSRRAYAMTSQVVGPLFVARSPFGRQKLVTAHTAIDALSTALETEDQLWSMVATMQRHLQTHTHAINTAVYAILLARLLSMSEDLNLYDVGKGALLHDIGKNRIPDQILDKPGPLDRDEWRIMRSHPEAGYAIVTEILGHVPSYAHIILEHHERADGSGYPTGSRGHEVPLDSQLVAIADAFDALTSIRPYKAASTPFEALRIMRFEMAGQFNDRLLREFILIVGGRGRFRRADYRALEVQRPVEPAGLEISA